MRCCLSTSFPTLSWSLATLMMQSLSPYWSLLHSRWFPQRCSQIAAGGSVAQTVKSRRGNPMGCTGVCPGGLTVLQGHTFNDVGHVLTTVDGVLDRLIDIFPLEDIERVLALLKELGDSRAVDKVALVLETVDLDTMLEDGVPALQVAQPHDRFLYLLHGA